MRDRVRAMELRAELKTSPIGLAVLAGTTVYLGVAFNGIAAPALLLPWLAAMGLIFAAWAVSIVLFVARRPDDAEILSRWIPWAKAVMTACNVGVAASVWILFVPADTATQYFMVNFYVWYVIVQVLAATEATQVATQAILLVLGALVAALLIDQVPRGLALSAFLTLFGASVIALRRLVRRSVVAAHEARARAEDAGEALAAALALVKAERDARSRFIAAASHDLQQPVQAASLFFEQAIATADPLTRSRAVRGARAAFRAVRALLESMLASLRLEAGMMPARIAETSLPVLIDELIAGHDAEARSRRIALKACVPDMVVATDPALLGRALGNLIGNALRHSRGTRVLVAVRREPAGAIAIAVLDDGVGIDPGEAERLFDDYAQGGGAEREHGGFGLGLASARRIAELLGGSLTLDPRWRRGCAFRLSLPGPVDTQAAPRRAATG